MQVLCEKYSPENFPYRRGPGMGVHVPATPQGSPMKGRVLVFLSISVVLGGISFLVVVSYVERRIALNWPEKETPQHIIMRFLLKS